MALSTMDQTPDPLPVFTSSDEAQSSLRLLADALPQLVWSTRPDGFHDYYNRRWYDYTGITPEESAGAGWSTLLHSDDLQRSIERWQQALATGEPYEIEYRLQRASDGVYRWFLGRALPIRNAQGEIVRWFGTCTDIDDQKRAEQGMAARAEREALVNRISLAIRRTLDPEAIQSTVVNALGAALGADRCYFVTADFARDLVIIGQDWRRDEALPSVMGEYRAADFGPLLRDLFADGTTACVEDVRAGTLSAATASVLEQFRQRSLLCVPLYDRGRLIAALFVAMADAPRDWTPSDVTLAEDIATMTRSAVELARVHQRERNIANTLQGALQPILPDHIPGLDLASFYRAALDEASVGGDFSDVFPVEKNCYVLVVGDLSGKGLDAAAQVATVRNMLRYALYTGRSIAEAVTRLNNILITNRLLTGFATLVVVTYDMAMKTLTYVSCGQEPALLRRTADGLVEELFPTGPILGVTEAAQYSQKEITIAPGDAFALYTDGLTEAGPNRRELLGVSGLADLLRNGGGRAQDILTQLVVGAEAHANGVFTDDVCLLVGVVENNSRPARDTCA